MAARIALHPDRKARGYSQKGAADATAAKVPIRAETASFAEIRRKIP
jgi:hypothetical protein